MARRIQSDQEPQAAAVREIIGQITWEISGLYPAAGAWRPAINVYQFPQRLEVCVDLAGVEKEKIEVTVEPGQLRIAGVRAAPEPADPDPSYMRIINMEIDYGPFERVITIPSHVDLDRVQSECRQGMLWVYLTLGPG